MKVHYTVGRGNSFSFFKKSLLRYQAPRRDVFGFNESLRTTWYHTPGTSTIYILYGTWDQGPGRDKFIFEQKNRKNKK